MIFNKLYHLTLNLPLNLFFIWGIQPTFSEAHIYESLWSVYSAFGALYLLKVCPNATVAEPGFYAMVKFYSSVQASKAQRATDKQCLFQSSPLKLKDISKCVEDGCQEEADDQGVFLKYGCIAELTFPQHGVSCQGVGVAEEIIDNDRDPEEKLRKRGILMKRAKDKAVVVAFEKVLLMILGNGKLAIEIKYDPDEILPEENSEGVIKVNDISWNEFEGADSHTEDDIPWDLTVDLPH
ncbi:RAD52 motif-containing protein 1 isoform X3 [Megalobrama amblycephala]|uniref:RAD52 motif-containing protein 1 isoform X3 n=1 Tax=Megalobrama amblycephala TaxID=75352 RepID=UPI0020142ACA|nr:RAD52 motif-containing protein 1 isoform X3 [Megalobrama amblycephala]